MDKDDLRLLVELAWTLNYLKRYSPDSIPNPFEHPSIVTWLHDKTRGDFQVRVINNITNRLWHDQGRSKTNR